MNLSEDKSMADPNPKNITVTMTRAAWSQLIEYLKDGLRPKVEFTGEADMLASALRESRQASINVARLIVDSYPAEDEENKRKLRDIATNYLADKFRGFFDRIFG